METYIEIKMVFSSRSQSYEFLTTRKPKKKLAQKSFAVARFLAKKFDNKAVSNSKRKEMKRNVLWLFIVSIDKCINEESPMYRRQHKNRFKQQTRKVKRGEKKLTNT